MKFVIISLSSIVLVIITLYIGMGNPFISNPASQTINAPEMQAEDLRDTTDKAETSTPLTSEDSTSSERETDTQTKESSQPETNVSNTQTETVATSPLTTSDTQPTSANNIPSYFDSFIDCTPTTPEPEMGNLNFDEINEETLPESTKCMGRALAQDCSAAYIAGLSSTNPETYNISFIQPRGQVCEIGFNVTSVFGKTLDEPQLTVCNIQKIIGDSTDPGQFSSDDLVLAESAPGTVFFSVSLTAYYAILDTNAKEKFDCRVMDL